jgi:UDP-glucose:(heptosyl)LPS alpha-1,3-glucosyltransferase
MLPVRKCDLYHPHAGIATAAFPTWKKKLEAILNPRRILFAKVEKSLLANQKTKVLCLSNAIRAEAKRRFQLSDDRAPLLFNAIDLKKFAPSRPGVKPDPNRLDALIIAQDFHRKGVHAVIFAMSDLKEVKNLHLTVVGRDVRMAAGMKQLSDTYKVANRVHFVGPARDPRPHYEAADFFVLPTAHDPCSLVVLEALAMGLPVITTKINGAAEATRDGEHGFIIDSQEDHAQLAECMKMMLDSATRAQMSAACLALRPGLAYERHLETLLAIYENARH